MEIHSLYATLETYLQQLCSDSRTSLDRFQMPDFKKFQEIFHMIVTYNEYQGTKGSSSVSSGLQHQHLWKAARIH